MKPNYRQQRSERARSSGQKRDEKLREKQARTEERKARLGGEPGAEPSADAELPEAGEPPPKSD